MRVSEHVGARTPCGDGRRPRRLLRARLSEPTLHRETGAESRLDDSRSAEAARGIETFRVRVADDVQNARGACARGIGAMFDEQSPHTSFPQARLDKQRIELGIPVRPCPKPTITPSRSATNT
jgi:hypothetical protein